MMMFSDRRPASNSCCAIGIFYRKTPVRPGDRMLPCFSSIGQNRWCGKSATLIAVPSLISEIPELYCNCYCNRWSRYGFIITKTWPEFTRNFLPVLFLVELLQQVLPNIILLDKFFLLCLETNCCLLRCCATNWPNISAQTDRQRRHKSSKRRVKDLWF